MKPAHKTIKAHLRLTEDSKDGEEDKEEVLEEVRAKSSATTLENEDILHVTVRIQLVLLVNIVSNLIVL